MQYHDARSRAPIVVRRAAAALAVAFVAASVVVASPVAAAELAVPTGITAQMISHTGWDADVAARPDAGDCARYGSAASGVATGPIANPGGDPGAAAAGFTDGRSGVVSPGSIAYSSHGNTARSGCGGAALDLSSQSAVGFEPAVVTSVRTATVFNLGRMVHRNNPLSTLVNSWFRGTMQVNLLGMQLPYEWQLHETTNTAQPASNPANNDVLEFLGTIGDQSFTGPDGERYTLVVSGFTAPLADGSCAPTLADPATAINRFETVEQASTYGCLYAQIERVVSLTIVKIAEAAQAPTGGIPSSTFTSSSDAPGSPWSTGFALTPTALGGGGAASVTHDVVEGETITISEDTPATPWRLTSLTCVDGDGSPLAITAGAQISLAGELPATDPIVCTYTNTDTTIVEPVGSLTMTKSVSPRDGTDAAGYTGGSDRLFAIDYACTLGGIEATSGTAQVSISAPAVIEALPVGAECAITGESLALAPGDFVDASYAWDGYDASPAVTVTEGTTVTLAVDNRFTGGPVDEPGGPVDEPGGPGSGTPPTELPLTETSSTGGTGSLARTGSDSLLPLVAGGGILLAAGVLALTLRRARRSEEPGSR